MDSRRRHLEGRYPRRDRAVPVGRLCGRAALALALFSAGSAAAQSLPNATATLVQVIDTSQFHPPSPDPSGITYLPDSGTLIMVDGEVDEMSIFAGKNLFEIDLAGNLLDSGLTMPESDEPVGAAYDPTTGHLFLSDDTGVRSVYEFNPGPDGRFGTSDDLVASFSTGSFGATDPEGLAYDWIGRRLFVIDGIGARIYQLEPGSNGVFDSGDLTAIIDLAPLGINDAEGGEFDVATGTLLVVDKRTHVVLQLTPEGVPLRTIDISHPLLRRPAGLALGPASDGSGQPHLWVADRATDNNSDPNENDGKIFEFSFPPLSGNQAPIATASALPSNAAIGQVVSLQGTAVDDGLPAPPALQTTWRQRSGPAAASITSPGALNTTASFPAAGTYLLALEADDGALLGAAEVSVVVTGGSGGGTSGTAQVRIAASLDDVEEESTGSIGTTSTDLDFSDGRVIGMRFPNLAVPQGTTVTRAYVQFQVDEANSGPTVLELRAQASNNAPPFTTTRYDVSSRPTTSASVTWPVAPWTVIGEAGPLQQTPELASIVQEVVNRPGWAAGNALVMAITGTGLRVAESFNGVPGSAPLLVVDYDSGGPPPPPVNQAPSVGAGAPQTIRLPATTAALVGTANDDGLPNPPASLSLLWSQKSGPAGVVFSAPGAASTNATFPGAGSYVLKLSANDGALVSTAETTVTVQDPSATQTFETAIATGLDDAEEASGGKMRLTSTDLDLVYDKGNQIVGMRFTGIPIPQGASVTRAWVQFVVDEASADPTTLLVRGQAADDAAQFTSAKWNVSTRAPTSASVGWFPPAWTSVGAAGPDHRTPDLAPIVQEIVGRSGWSPGNALVILISGQGLRVAESKEGKVGAAPVLHVEYGGAP